jgi:dipeptidyl aminopeptidase/acylaminoacyl peptidase
MAYCYLYLPKNQNYSSMGKPPLLILVHGGPTANSDSNYANYIQYWTSSGFAVIDIEHRGSTGFGRKYRDKLLGNWGLIEISDIEDAIKYLVQKNVIMNKVAITGGSAGGYTVQRALTSIPDLFQVGGSHFGIGNLLTLKKLTHKFESKYLDLLIGEEEQRFIDRSPVNHLDKLKAPMIIFQGLDDKVVPPELSREIAEILKQKGIKSEYIEYPGEGHGFRQLDNKVDSLKKESIFFKEVLKEK